MMDWDDLRFFLVIARHGSLSAAARVLNVQQSTMGRRLAALEERTGARLLHKTPSGFVLTPAGEAIMGNVERIEAEALSVERAITGKDIRLEGVIKLTTLEIMAVDPLPSVIAALQLQYPGIMLDVIADDRSLSLTKREADIALRLSRVSQNDIAVRKIGEIQVTAYASQAYLDRFGTPDFANGAAGHRLILASEDRMWPPDLQWLAAMAPKAAVSLRMNSRLGHITAALEGIGIAVIPRYIGDPKLSLVRLEVPSILPPREMWLCVHNDIRHTPRIRAVTDFLAAEFRRLAPRLSPVES